jgi:uncharacterized membrane protein YdjX (TVP38/TMEM64 family)
MNARTARFIPRGPLSPLWAAIAGVVLVGALLAVLVYFDIHIQLLAMLEWVERQGAWAAVLFILIMALVVVLLLPGIFFTAGAGFVFGVIEGKILVVVGTTVGAVLAFLIARYLFGQRARDFIVEHSKLKLVHAEMSRNDWKVVLLTRLIPFFPGKLSNYFFGLTGFRLGGYALGSLIGFIPFSLHNAYLGSLAADIAALTQQELGRTPAQWLLYGIGFAATVVAVIYFNRLAQRALRQYTDTGDNKEDVA